MLTTAELRWFWFQDLPPGLEQWFADGERHETPLGTGEWRVDSYLYAPTQTALGLKRRGTPAELEVKGRIGTAGHLEVAPFRGNIELWIKWRMPALDLMPSLTVIKRRWQRVFNTGVTPPAEPAGNDSGTVRPKEGCSAELTRLVLPDDQVWWTFAFEGFGNPAAVGNHVRSVAGLLAARDAPALDGGLSCGYPQWLSQLSPHG